MSETSRYNFKLIEEKWQSHWHENNSFKVKIDNQKEKFYCLEMFPYPQEKFIWVMLEIIRLVMY